MTLSAHLWTVWPLIREQVRPWLPPEAEDWARELEDPDVGRVRLTGHFGRPRGARDLVILVHGLGGSAASRYILRAARVAHELGLATLRLNLRGADRQGDDLHHAGFTRDLEAALECPRLRSAENVYVLGFSLGGHIALRFATEVADGRVKAVAAVCSPLILENSVRAFDRPIRWPYRRYVLSGLFEIYDEIARCREVPVPPEEVRRVKTLYDFDRLTVVPRFGFESPEDYYRRAGVGSRLKDLKVPSLLVAATDDPMVDASAIRPALDGDGGLLEVRWSKKGGHVSFPPGLDLGLGTDPGLERQILHWLVSRT